MEPTNNSLIKFDGTRVEINLTSLAEGKLALKELKLKKKEYGLLKRLVNERQKQIRASYTDQVRKRGSMIRGAGTLGKIARHFETRERDSQREQLANALAPLEKHKQQIEAMTRNIDLAILRVETYLLQQDK